MRVLQGIFFSYLKLISNILSFALKNIQVNLIFLAHLFVYLR